MKYNKLVRDNIPKIIEQKGGKAITHIATEDEYWQKLKEKLVEEAEEFVKSEEKLELADILEIIDAICEYKNFNKKEVEEIRIKRKDERGGFKKKIILEES